MWFIPTVLGSCRNNAIITGSQHNSGWQGPGEVSSPSLCPEQAQRWAQMGLLRLNPVRKLNSPGQRWPSLLGAQLHNWAVLMGKKHLFISSLSLPCFNLWRCVSPSHHTLLWRAGCVFNIPSHPLLSVLRTHLDATKALLSPGWTRPDPNSLSLQDKGSNHTFSVASPEPIPDFQCIACTVYPLYIIYMSQILQASLSETCFFLRQIVF